MPAITSIRSFSNTNKFKNIPKKLANQKQIHPIPTSERHMRSEGVRVNRGSIDFGHTVGDTHFTFVPYSSGWIKNWGINFKTRQDGETGRDSRISRYGTQCTGSMQSEMPMASSGPRSEQTPTSTKIQDNAGSTRSV